jgi:hypothetical protein
MSSVLIRGTGIAGSCCARLLGNAGLRISVETLPRPKLPAVLLTETTQKLLRDVFERDDLFSGFPQIRKRIVVWGPECEPLTLPHSAALVSEQALLERVQQMPAPAPAAQQAEREQLPWTIFASAPLNPSSAEHHFGSRPAAVTPAKLKPQSDAEACWIESLENGWLFLLPGGNGTGWLLSVGDSADSLLAASRVIHWQIAELGSSRGTFLSHPRIALPLSGPGWLACGTAALAFDPLCGDGVGNAVREAILGSAIVQAALDGGDEDRLAAHYQARLLAGFQRHLTLCVGFYRSGRCGPWWDDQLRNLEQGLAWCSAQLTDKAAFGYRLNGFALDPVE